MFLVYETWTIENAMQHETCKLNLPTLATKNPLGIQTILSSEEMLHIVAWGCTWHGRRIAGNNYIYEGRNERGNIFISIHVSIYFSITHSSEEYIFPYISLKLFVCWLTWLVAEQYTYEWSFMKDFMKGVDPWGHQRHTHTLKKHTSVHPFVGYHLLHPLYSPIWWQRCSFNLQACRTTKQARSTCVVANLLGMHGTENLVWANDLLKGDQDTANMIWSTSHQKISMKKQKIQRPYIIKRSGPKSRSLK